MRCEERWEERNDRQKSEGVLIILSEVRSDSGYAKISDVRIGETERAEVRE